MAKANLPALTGYRALAAYSVLIGHACDVSFSYAGALSPIHAYTVGLAYLGMTTFFVLSGFVIIYNYGELFAINGWWTAFTKFMIARVARLYPLYFIFLVIGVGRQWDQLFGGKIPELLSFLTLTQSWFNYQMITFPPSWSISTEAFFYVVFALLTLVPFSIKGWGGKVLFAASLVVGVLVLFYVAWGSSENISSLIREYVATPSSPDAWGWLTYFSPYVRMFEFFLGMCSGWLFLSSADDARTEAVPASAYVATAACFVGIIVLLFVRMIPALAHPFVVFLSTNFGFAPFLATLFYFSCKYDMGLTRVFSSSPIVFCGEISYSVYVIQCHVFSLFPAYISGGPGPEAFVSSAARVLVFIAFTTVFSYGSFLLIEKPARNALRSRLSQLLLRN